MQNLYTPFSASEAAITLLSFWWQNYKFYKHYKCIFQNTGIYIVTYANTAATIGSLEQIDYFCALHWTVVYFLHYLLALWDIASTWISMYEINLNKHG